MNKKLKKSIFVVSLIALLVLSVGSVAFAANVQYDTSALTDTDYVWMDDVNPGYSFSNTSRKTIDGYDWKIITYHVQNIQGAGIRIYPVAPGATGYYGDPAWVNSVTSSYSYYDCSTMKNNTDYRLMCRLDNDYDNTWMQADGYWNAN